MQLTLDLMEAFVRCRYKAFLKITDQTGPPPSTNCSKEGLPTPTRRRRFDDWQKDFLPVKLPTARCPWKTLSKAVTG